jgi:hypothetical protein
MLGHEIFCDRTGVEGVTKDDIKIRSNNWLILSDFIELEKSKCICETKEVELIIYVFNIYVHVYFRITGSIKSINFNIFFFCHCSFVNVNIIAMAV